MRKLIRWPLFKKGGLQIALLKYLFYLMDDRRKDKYVTKITYYYFDGSEECANTIIRSLMAQGSIVSGRFRKDSDKELYLLAKDNWGRILRPNDVVCLCRNTIFGVWRKEDFEEIFNA